MITGHRDLTPSTTSLVETAIRRFLTPHAPEMVGVSCLAEGADQIFADVVLDLGGLLEVIVVAERHHLTLAPAHRASYGRLLGRAGAVRRLPFSFPSPEIYAEANRELLEGADLMVAVWDGRPENGVGGTAEVVREARNRRIEVRVLWPVGATRASAGVSRDNQPIP
ncbi:hypothetical protein [Streptosporangium sp. NPDC002524]|uniref:hypothetical protein n=1 Tax=Streptosporangium sp. NPDC002524 TaxID=3154537 RepID=UPI003332E4C2